MAENTNLDKKEIISKLFIKEEDELQTLNELVLVLAKFIAVDPKSKKVIYKRMDLANPDRIALYLCAMYFLKQDGVIESETVNLEELSKSLAVPKTTMSAPIKRLIDESIIERTEQGVYKIPYYRIKTLVESLTKKYNME